ncbi:hypothetical protein GGI24_002988 [Coemansia furcata]|nr:hypothetical protein GGI24_002988 [Coemansia furcata]
MSVYEARALMTASAACDMAKTPRAVNKALERELGPKPKRPKYPHRLYRESVVNDIYRENPGILSNEADKLVCSRWTNLSEEGRQPFKDHYSALRQQYKSDLATYNSRKEALISSCSESVSTARPTEPEHPKSSTPLSTLPRSTERLTEPECTAAFPPPAPLPWPTVRVVEPEHTASSSLPVLLPRPTVCVAEPERPTPLTSLSSSPQLPEQPGGSEMTQSDEEIERELGPKPKRAARAYDVFYHETICDRLKENPDLCVDDARKGVYAMWLNGSWEMRKSHIDRFKASREQYDAAIRAYYARARALVTAAYGIPEAPNPSDVLEWKLGSKPDPPVSAIHLYYLDVHEDVVKDNPNLRVEEVDAFVVAQWKVASKDVRQKYKDRYDELKKEHVANVASYNSRERALFKAAICKVRESRENCFANAFNTTWPSQQPVTSTLPGRPSQLTERLNGPECPTSLASSGLIGLPPLLPAPIGSFGSHWPIGFPVLSQPMLSPVSAPLLANPPGLPWPTLPLAPVTWLDNSPNLPWPALPSLPTPSDSALPVGTLDVDAPAHSLASLWPAEITIPDQPPESPSLSANSGTLPKQTISVGDSTLPTLAVEAGCVVMAAANTTATVAAPTTPPESIPLGMRPMSAGFQDTAETETSVRSSQPSLCMDPPAPDTALHVHTTPVNSVIGVEPDEPLAPTKKRSKKKRKHAADDDVQELSATQSTSSHRKRAKGNLKEGKKKKQKSKVVVKLEDDIDAASTTNKENCQTVNTGSIINAAAQISVSATENPRFL